VNDREAARFFQKAANPVMPPAAKCGEGAILAPANSKIFIQTGDARRVRTLWSVAFRLVIGRPGPARRHLPDIGNLNDYSLYLWKNGQWVFDAFLGADTLFNFGPGGVSEFEIRGIDPAVDASNGAEFMTQVTFTGDGTFDGSMTAVVPESSTWAMMLVGFAGLGCAGFRRKAARSVAA
jgi:hypothetical protein